jgi:hypothetical protein
VYIAISTGSRTGTFDRHSAPCKPMTTNAHTTAGMDSSKFALVTIAYQRSPLPANSFAMACVELSCHHSDEPRKRIEADRDSNVSNDDRSTIHHVQNAVEFPTLLTLSMKA